jgi:hypothetical protein
VRRVVRWYVIPGLSRASRVEADHNNMPPYRFTCFADSRLPPCSTLLLNSFISWPEMDFTNVSMPRYIWWPLTPQDMCDLMDRAPYVLGAIALAMKVTGLGKVFPSWETAILGTIFIIGAASKVQCKKIIP